MSRKKPDLLTQQARLRRKHREKGQVLAIFRKPMRESLTSVLPITAIVLLLCFTVTPVSNNAMMAFLVGSLLLIVGMGLFSLGSEMSMIPLGEAVGKEITRSKKVWIIVAISFLIGVIITVAEPDLQVLASQVPAIENNVIIWSVALGVGVFLVIALLRILLGIPLSYLLIGFYAVVFTLAMFVSPDFWSIAFDSGGVTTGPMTVPFIMALGVGVSAVRNDKHAGGDSFGLVALCSIGPILTVLLLGLLYKPDGSSYTPVTVPDAQDTVEMFRSYTHALPEYFKEILVSLAPIAGFFLIFQLLTRRLNRRQVMSMIVGFLYTYLGLVLFLTGVNVGFMPVGNFLGQSIASLECSWVLIPIAMVIGYFIGACRPHSQPSSGGDHRRLHPRQRHESGPVHRRIRVPGPGHDPGADGHLHHVVPAAGLCPESDPVLRGAEDLHLHRLRLRRRGLRSHDRHLPAALRHGRLRRPGRQRGHRCLRRGGHGGHDPPGDHPAAGRQL